MSEFIEKMEKISEPEKDCGVCTGYDCLTSCPYDVHHAQIKSEVLEPNVTRPNVTKPNVTDSSIVDSSLFGIDETTPKSEKKQIKKTQITKLKDTLDFKNSPDYTSIAKNFLVYPESQSKTELLTKQPDYSIVSTYLHDYIYNQEIASMQETTQRIQKVADAISLSTLTISKAILSKINETEFLRSLYDCYRQYYFDDYNLTASANPTPMKLYPNGGEIGIEKDKDGKVKNFFYSFVTSYCVSPSKKDYLTKSDLSDCFNYPVAIAVNPGEFEVNVVAENVVSILNSKGYTAKHSTPYWFNKSRSNSGNWEYRFVIFVLFDVKAIVDEVHRDLLEDTIKGQKGDTNFNPLCNINRDIYSTLIQSQGECIKINVVNAVIKQAKISMMEWNKEVNEIGEVNVGGIDGINGIDGVKDMKDMKDMKDKMLDKVLDVDDGSVEGIW